MALVLSLAERYSETRSQLWCPSKSINLKTVGTRRRLVEQSTNFAVLGSFLQFPVEIVVLLSRDLPGWRIADRFKFKLLSQAYPGNILSAGLPAKSRPIGDEFSGRSGLLKLSLILSYISSWQLYRHRTTTLERSPGDLYQMIIGYQLLQHFQTASSLQVDSVLKHKELYLYHRTHSTL